MAFVPDEQQDSFTPDEPVTPVVLPGPGPVSSALAPLPLARDPGNIITSINGVANESGRPKPTISAGVPQPALVVYQPSEEDMAVTKRLVEAGKLLGIEVLDHVIVTAEGYSSFKEKNLL